MAVKVLKCPSCNGEITLDDSKEFGFCMYCGNKIQLTDENRMKIEVSGKVELDESKKNENCSRLAEMAFANGNYDEAYAYYSKCLENNMNDVHSMFMRGLSALYLSDLYRVRVADIKTAVRASLVCLENSPQAAEEKLSMANAVFGFAVAYMRRFCSQPQTYLFTDFATAKARMNSAAMLPFVMDEAVSLLDDGAVAASRSTEDAKKEMLVFAIQACDTALSSVKCHNGYKEERTKNGIVKTEIRTEVFADNPQEAGELKKKFTAIYNNLPQFRNAINDFEEQKGKQQAVIDEYNASLNNFFDSHQEFRKNYYRKAAKPFFISSAACAVAVFFSAAFSNVLASDFIYVLMSLFSVGCLALLITAIVKGIISVRDKKRIEKQFFGEELLSKKAESEKSRKELKKIESSQKSYMNKNLR